MKIRLANGKLNIGNALYVAAFAMVLTVLTGWNPVAIFSGLVALSFVPVPNGSLLMAVTREIWTADIVNNLYKDNAFALRAFNADQYVLSGKVVHIAVAGAASTITKNATSFPVSAVKRTDTDITYNIDTFYSTPRHIEQIEKYELAYDKRQSVLGEDQSALIQSAMDNLLYLWAPAAAYNTPTTGASTPATLSGATGNRKKFDKAEFSTIKKAMDKANIPTVGRVAVLTADHYSDFLNSLTQGEQTEVGRVADMATGKVGQYLGFDIYMRSSVLRYREVTGTDTPIDEQANGYAADATDRAGSLFYQESCVERALGNVDIFDNQRQAEYYGDVVSMELRLGGRIRRATGVWAAVEAIV